MKGQQSFNLWPYLNPGYNVVQFGLDQKHLLRVFLFYYILFNLGKSYISSKFGIRCLTIHWIDFNFVESLMKLTWQEVFGLTRNLLTICFAHPSSIYIYIHLILCLILSFFNIALMTKMICSQISMLCYLFVS